MSVRVVMRDGSTAMLCTGGREYRIGVGSKVIAFEMHPMCGPLPMNKDGTGASLVPSHPFWGAVTQWAQEGSRVDETTGMCVRGRPTPDPQSKEPGR